MNKGKKTALSAEINVVCDVPLETMMQQIEALRDKTTQVTLQPVDDNTTLFRLVYMREGRSTASVTGQIRRWAESMTHVVCDGDAIQPRQWRWSRLLMFVVAVLVSLPLVTLVSGNFVTGLSGLLMYTGLVLGTLFVVALLDIGRRMIWQPVPEQRFAAHQTGIPHYKDRERLLQKIVTCVQPSEVPGRLTLPENAPLAADSPDKTLRYVQK